MKKISLGIPKGTLNNSVIAFLKNLNITFTFSDRTLWDNKSNEVFNFVLLNPHDIPKLIEKGLLDFGFTGNDIITEYYLKNNTISDIIEVYDTKCSKYVNQPTIWKLAFPKNSPILSNYKSVNFSIATEITKISAAWASDNHLKAAIFKSNGCTEAQVPFFYDSIIECVHSGASFQQNNLIPVETVFKSTTRLITNSSNKQMLHLLNEVIEFKDIPLVEKK